MLIVFVVMGTELAVSKKNGPSEKEPRKTTRFDLHSYGFHATQYVSLKMRFNGDV